MQTTLKILLLEDDVRDAELIRAELRKGGLSVLVHRVETQKEFVDMLVHEPPDLILSDHGLPSFNGFEALAVARHRCPELPFIFVTGLAGTEQDIETFERESIGYVLKSRLSRLVPAVQQVISDIEKQRERRNRQQRWQQDEEYYRALLDSVRDYAIFRLDGNGCVSSWNAGAQWIKGYEADEMMGKHLADFFPAQAVTDGLPARALIGAKTEGRFQAETVLVRKGGTPFWADVILTRLEGVPEHSQGFALVVCDITARKEAATVQERLFEDLKATLDNVKILSGLLPICASCKKIRDYKGHWHPLEVYLRNNSEATLMHEFCTDCVTHIQSASLAPDSEQDVLSGP